MYSCTVHWELRILRGCGIAWKCILYIKDRAQILYLTGQPSLCVMCHVMCFHGYNRVVIIVVIGILSFSLQRLPLATTNWLVTCSHLEKWPRFVWGHYFWSSVMIFMSHSLLAPPTPAMPRPHLFPCVLHCAEPPLGQYWMWRFVWQCI